MLANRFIVFIFLFLLIPTSEIFAFEPIKITLSGQMNDVIFDGKWTSRTEWKQSSWNTFSFEDNQVIQLRSAHQNNFIYFMVDFQSDTNPDYKNDKVMICLDTKNDKAEIPNTDDFCFLSVLNGDATIFQGTGQKDIPLREIPNSFNFFANGTLSDENDRYSKTPHSGYEFKIPTDLVGRHSTYGFFLVAYDAHTKTIFNWPQNSEKQTFENLKPNQWGELVSLDKTLPEFDLPILVLIPAMFLIIYLSRFKILQKFKKNDN